MNSESSVNLGPLPEQEVGGLYPSIVKPAIDRLSGAIGLLLLSPVFLLIALAIRCEGRGGSFFRQERIGLLGRPFSIVKFRTMIPGAQELGTGLLVRENDSRITRIGRLLRATSLDELPQLWNVLCGEMSLVGPRPTLAQQVKRYDDFQRRRLRVRPGMTGLAQVRGRKSIPWDDRIRIDIEYLENLSFFTDLKIVVETVRVVLGADDPPAKADYWKEKEGGGPDERDGQIDGAGKVTVEPGALTGENDGSAAESGSVTKPRL